MLTLTKEHCITRRAALIQSAEVDRIVIGSPRHIQYLTGMYVTPLALSAWGPAALLIDAGSGESTLIVPNTLEEAAQAAHVDGVEVWRVYDAVTDPGIDAYRVGVDQLNARLKKNPARRLGFEAGWLPYSVDAGPGAVDISGRVHEMRRRKYPDELALIREAVRAVGAGHRAARESIRAGLTELDVYNAIHTAIVTEAGSAVLLLGDYASGERVEKGGGPPTARTLRDGDLMICDVFPVVNGYRGDCTATLSVGGHLTERQQGLETALHEAISAGEGALSAGVRCRDVYHAVRGALEEHSLAEYFPHHAGHGLGLGHPEAPFFVPGSDETLVAGDVVTLEPGAYGPGFGARIEHNYLVTETGFERLSHHSTLFA